MGTRVYGALMGTSLSSTVLVCVVMMSMVLWPGSNSIDALQVLPLPVMVDQLS